MAYRRRQGITRSSTFKEEIYHHPGDDNSYSKLKPSQTFTGSSSLAAQAMRASAAHRDSSLSSAYAGDSLPQSSSNKVFDAYDGTSRNDTKGFWGIVARKAKEIFEDENLSQQFEAPARSRFQMQEPSSGAQSQQSYLSTESFKKMDNPTLRKGFDRLASKLNHIGDTFEKAFEEGRTIVETKTADIKQHIRRKGNGQEGQNQVIGSNSSWQQPMMQPAQLHDQMNHETQLKASRDVAMATAAKAKLLLRELKTVKADLAFAKQRCSQLEEENKMLREGREKGSNAADDDLIRLQLETLLAEKARLALENSIYARENRFLREIVEYHQLTMQDVVYLDEGTEEVTEVYPITRMLSGTPPSPSSPPTTSEVNTSAAAPVTVDNFPVNSLREETEEEPERVAESGVLTIKDGEDNGKSNGVTSAEVVAETQDNKNGASIRSHDL